MTWTEADWSEQVPFCPTQVRAETPFWRQDGHEINGFSNRMEYCISHEFLFFLLKSESIWMLL